MTTNGKIVQGSTAGTKVSDTINADLFNCAGANNDLAGRFGLATEVNSWLNALKIAPVSFGTGTNAFVSIEYIPMANIDQNGVNYKANEGFKAADATCANNLAASWADFAPAAPCAANTVCRRKIVLSTTPVLVTLTGRL